MKVISRTITHMAMEERSFLMENITKVIFKKAKRVVMVSSRTSQVVNMKERGWMTNSMGLEKRYGIMAQRHMKESSLMGKRMEGADLSGMTGLTMRGTLLMVCFMAMALITSGSQIKHSQGSSKREESREKENQSGPMVVNIRVTLRMAKKMVMARSSLQTETFILENSTKVKCMASLFILMLKKVSRDMVNGEKASALLG